MLCDFDSEDFWKTVTQSPGFAFARQSPLPSWCPDWYAPKVSQSFVGDHRAGFPDAKDIDPKLSIPAQSDWLFVAGFTIDTVRSSTEPHPLMITDSFHTEEHRTKSWSWLQECCPIAGDVLPRPEDAIKAMYQTLVVATGKLTVAECKGRAFMANFCSLHAWSSGVPFTDVEIPPIKLFNIELFAQAHGRRFFNTAGGRVGPGPPDMEAGDQIVVFKGAKVLFVLRRIDRSSKNDLPRLQVTDLGEEDDKFELIGDAYVHGLMQGEAFTAEDRGPDTAFVLV